MEYLRYKRTCQNGNDKLSKYHKIRKIGSGTYGEIYICRKDNAYCVMKVINKYKLIGYGARNKTYLNKHEQNSIKWQLNERNLLKLLDNKYIVKYNDSFQTENDLHLILEYIPGGDLFTLLCNKSAKSEILGENVCKYYAYDIFKGLSYLHNHNITHGDLKLENILINLDGHLKLCDFGFAHKSDEIDLTLRGTIDYMAPEQLLESKYSNKVDIWSFGIILYELCTGFLPFNNENYNRCGQLHCILSQEIKYPNSISNDMRELLKQMLQINPDDRPTINELRNHKWFDFENYKHAKPYFIPQIKTITDTRYFDDYSKDTEYETFMPVSFQKYFKDY